jgi:3-oxoacyl-[acyl-carrier-protein] synthase II
VVAPNGGSLPAFWRSVLAARSGIRTIADFDTTDMKTRIAGQVKDFDLSNYLDEPVKASRLSRQTQLCLAATRMAIDHSRITQSELNREEALPIFLGVSTSNLEVLETGVTAFVKQGANRVSSKIVNSSPPHSTASAIAKYLGTKTKLTTLSTACTAGVTALEQGSQMIRNGQSDLILVGAADAPVTPFGMALFCSARLMSTQNSQPEKASRPFDLQRDGGVLSEGAGMLVVENLEHALARGATIYAEILGGGHNTDHPDESPASGFQESMMQAISNSGLHPNRISYINAHGSSDPTMDQVESDAIKKIFGPDSLNIPVSSIKGVTGNPLAAAGAMQLVFFT